MSGLETTVKFSGGTPCSLRSEGVFLPALQRALLIIGKALSPNPECACRDTVEIQVHFAISSTLHMVFFGVKTPHEHATHQPGKPKVACKFNVCGRVKFPVTAGGSC